MKPRLSEARCACGCGTKIFLEYNKEEDRVYVMVWRNHKPASMSMYLSRGDFYDLIAPTQQEDASEE